MDASSYSDNIKLFRTALDKHGRVDHAIACAGIIERGKWFDPELTIDTVEQPATNATVDLNFLGVAYFTRIAVAYLRHARGKADDRSITLISSAAGFRDSPGLFMYQVCPPPVQPKDTPQSNGTDFCVTVYQTRRHGPPPQYPQSPLRARPGMSIPIPPTFPLSSLSIETDT